MTINESESVAIKRRGAKYVAKLIKGKTEKEQLEFWEKRTKSLLKKSKKKELVSS